MTDPLAHLLFIIVCWPIHAVSPSPGKPWILPVAGLVYLLIYAPVAAVFICIMSVEAALLFVVCRKLERNSSQRKYLPYVILPNFLFVDFHSFIFLINVETLAISFSTIRVFMTLKQLLGSRQEESFGQVMWIFAAAYFLPALIVGPVFSGTDLRRDNRQPGSIRQELSDYRRILMGYVLCALANPTLASGTAAVLQLTGLPNWVAAPSHFLQLFTAFWGQSLIAEHSSRFFGYRLPQNFNQPWRALDIKDFWARWHRSMAMFVMQYIYFPLNLSGVSPRCATISAFVFMGLWHNLTPGYFLWGIGHGVLLAYWPNAKSDRAVTAVKRIATFAIVVTLSYTANFGSLS